MKKYYFIILSVLVSILGFQRVASAQDPEEEKYKLFEDLQKYTLSPEGIGYSKIITPPDNNGVYNIYLQTFVTGSKTAIKKSIPSDIVLVLDVSNSMIQSQNNITSYTYTANGTASTPRTYSNANGLYIEYPEGSGSYYPIQRQHQNRRPYYLYFEENGYRHYLSPDGIGGSTQPDPGASTNTETIWTGQLYDQNTRTISRLQALKEAVEVFLQTIHDDAVKNPDSILDHKVSIVKFSGPYVGGSAEAAMTPGNEQGGTNKPSTQVFKGWTSMTDQTVVTGLKEAVNEINTGTGTAIDFGMVLAQKLLGTSTPSTNDNPRSKTVVVFTDGTPSHYGMKDDDGQDMSETKIANAAISTANDIKQILAYTGPEGPVYTKIFTVGMLGSNPSGTALAVLQRSSSNYENATSMTTGTLVPGADYYFLANDAESLSAAFASIGASSGGASYEMDSETSAMVDVVSNSFMLPKNADVNSIEVFTSNCIGKYVGGDLNGLLKFEEADEDTWEDEDDWDEGRAQGIQVVLSDNRQQITVTNFEYSENWCGTETSSSGLQTYRGKKLILKIPIQMATSAVGGKDLATNAEGSGIIVNGETILKFTSPEVSLPVNMWVRKEGLEVGESAKFIIERAEVPDWWPELDSDDYPENSKDPRYDRLDWEEVSTIFVTRHKGQAKTGDNAPVTKVMGMASVNESDTEFIYRITEDPTWSWSYTPGTSTTIFTSDQLVTNPFVFSNTKKSGIDVEVRHAESKATNTFKNGDFIVDGKVVKKVDATHVGYDDSRGNGRTVIEITTETGTTTEPGTE